MSWRARMLFVVALAVGACLALAAWTGWMAGRGQHDALAAARDAHLLNTLRAGAESRLAIGLTLDQIETIQPLIERERASGAEIESIDIFSASGLLAYSTDRGAIGSRVAPAWITQLSASENWQLDHAGGRVVGTRLENDLGEAVGGVAVTLARREPDSDFLAWVLLRPPRHQLGWLLIGVGGLVLSVGLAAVLLGRPLRRYRKAAQVLRGEEPGSMMAHGDLYLVEARQRLSVVQAAEREIEASLRALRRMDDAE